MVEPNYVKAAAASEKSSRAEAGGICTLREEGGDKSDHIKPGGPTTKGLQKSCLLKDKKEKGRNIEK